MPSKRDRKEWSKGYYLKNKEKKLKYQKEYSSKHKEKIEEYLKDYRPKRYQMNRIDIDKKNRKREEGYLKEWSTLFPKIAHCEMCGKDLIFNSGENGKSIHFDHCHGGIAPIKHPMKFLRNSKRTPEKEALWKSCRFGILCLKCNICLPTIDRKQFIVNATRYAAEKEKEYGPYAF